MTCKVAIISPSFLPNIGGIEISAYLLARHLARKGFAVDVISYIPHGPASYCLQKGLCIHSVRLGVFSRLINNIYRYLLFSLDHLRLMVLRRYSVVVVFSSIPSWLIFSSIIFARLLRSRIVFKPSFRLFYMESSLAQRLLLKAWYLFIGAGVTKLADTIIAMSPLEARVLGKLSHHRNIVVVADPVLSPRLVTYSNVGDDCEEFLYVGRVSREKGVVELVKAFWLVRMLSRKELRLRIIGPSEKSYREFIERLVERLGISDSVIFNDAVEPWRLSDYYSRSCIVVVPSLHESFGRVIVEAMAHCRPIVATRFTPLSGLIEKAEIGLIVDPRDTIELAKALLWLSSNREARIRMGLRGRRIYETFYNPEHVLEALVRLIEQLCSSTG